MTGEGAGPTSNGNRASAAFEQLFPDAERIDAAGGGHCRRVRVKAKLDGCPTRSGATCPADRFGGAPRPDDIAALTGDPRWAALDPAEIVYLDTETTSLATASGTYTFLIGLGRLDGERMVVDQYFMEDYADERAMVEVVDAALAGAGALVTYNGRTFDVPLLTARWILQRRRLRPPDLHLDLLHYARRLWRLRLPGCSLSDVETHILGVRRLSDVDGSWVPRIYFDFMRGVRPERIVPVFDHHAQDILSLLALTSVMTLAFREPDHKMFAHASDQWGLARIYEMAGRREEALARIESAVLAARDEDLGFRLAMHLARAYKRCGRLGDAVEIWEARVAQARPDRLDPLVELAKHAEHTLKDLARARQWTERALGIVRGATELAELIGESDTTTRHVAALDHRLGRINRRSKKSKEAS